MDEFKDFAKEIRNRISNPFVFSFLVSWLFTNWPIPLAIIFYDKIDLKNDGFETLHDLIVHYSSNWGWFMLGQPLVFASLYTAFFPMIRAEINLHIAKITSRNETHILEKTNAGSMPLAKFIKLRNEHLDTIKELKKLNEEESGYLVKNAELEKDKAALEKDKLKLQSDNASSESKLEVYKNLSNYGITNGDWEFEISTLDNQEIRLFLNFSDDIVRDIHESHKTYLVQDLVVNAFLNIIHFKLKAEDQQESIGPVTLYGTNSQNSFRIRSDYRYYTQFTMTKIEKN